MKLHQFEDPPKAGFQKGVIWESKSWLAYLYHGYGRRQRLGLYPDLEDALRRYDTVAWERYGQQYPAMFLNRPVHPMESRGPDLFAINSESWAKQALPHG